MTEKTTTRTKSEKFHEVTDRLSGQTQLYKSFTKAQAANDAIAGTIKTVRERFVVREVSSAEVLKLSEAAQDRGVKLSDTYIDLTVAPVAPVDAPEVGTEG